MAPRVDLDCNAGNIQRRLLETFCLHLLSYRGRHTTQQGARVIWVIWRTPGWEPWAWPDLGVLGCLIALFSFWAWNVPEPTHPTRDPTFKSSMPVTYLGCCCHLFCLTFLSGFPHVKSLSWFSSPMSVQDHCHIKPSYRDSLNHSVIGIAYMVLL